MVSGDDTSVGYEMTTGLSCCILEEQMGKTNRSLKLFMLEHLHSLLASTMSATTALEDSATATDNWPQDDQTIDSVGNEQTTNGASPAAIEERSAGQETEQQQDHTRSSSVGAVETFRERQVKVLRSFLSVFACSFKARPRFGWATCNFEPE